MRWGIAIAVLCLTMRASLCAEQGGIKAEELKPDSKVSAQILCTLGMAMLFEEMVKQCKLPKAPADQGIEAAIARIESFIIANSSQRPQMSLFSDIRHQIEDRLRNSTDSSVCGNPSFASGDRGLDPVKFNAFVERILTSPIDPNQEPVGCGDPAPRDFK